jgi:hypothetical protein
VSRAGAAGVEHPSDGGRPTVGPVNGRRSSRASCGRAVAGPAAEPPREPPCELVHFLGRNCLVVGRPDPAPDGPEPAPDEPAPGPPVLEAGTAGPGTAGAGMAATTTGPPAGCLMNGRVAPIPLSARSIAEPAQIAASTGSEASTTSIATMIAYRRVDPARPAAGRLAARCFAGRVARRPVAQCPVAQCPVAW